MAAFCLRHNIYLQEIGQLGYVACLFVGYQCYQWINFLRGDSGSSDSAFLSEPKGGLSVQAPSTVDFMRVQQVVSPFIWSLPPVPYQIEFSVIVKSMFCRLTHGEPWEQVPLIHRGINHCNRTNAVFLQCRCRFLSSIIITYLLLKDEKVFRVNLNCRISWELD